MSHAVLRYLRKWHRVGYWAAEILIMIGGGNWQGGRICVDALGDAHEFFLQACLEKLVDDASAKRRRAQPMHALIIEMSR